MEDFDIDSVDMIEVDRDDSGRVRKLRLRRAALWIALLAALILAGWIANRFASPAPEGWNLLLPDLTFVVPWSGEIIELPPPIIPPFEDSVPPFSVGDLWRRVFGASSYATLSVTTDDRGRIVTAVFNYGRSGFWPIQVELERSPNSQEALAYYTRERGVLICESWRQVNENGEIELEVKGSFRIDPSDSDSIRAVLFEASLLRPDGNYRRFSFSNDGERVVGESIVTPDGETVRRVYPPQ